MDLPHSPLPFAAAALCHCDLPCATVPSRDKPEAVSKLLGSQLNCLLLMHLLECDSMQVQPRQLSCHSSQAWMWTSPSWSLQHTDVSR